MYFNMSTKKKRKKKNSRRSALVPVILILIVIMVALVAVWQLRGVIGSNATTARAVARTMGNSYSGTVVIARNERLYETENKTSIDFVAAEGSHVSRSGVICKVYSSGYNQTEINRLQTYRQEIQSYHVSTVFGSYVGCGAGQRKPGNRQSGAAGAHAGAGARRRQPEQFGKTAQQLADRPQKLSQAKISRRPDPLGLYKVENDQLKKIESWTTTYTASEDCIVSFYTDGYENSVNSSTYGTLNPSDVRAVIRGAMPEQSTVSRGSDPIFRTVIEDEWYALFLCQDRDWNPLSAKTYQMQLTGFDDYVIPAQVVSFTRIGSDLLLRMHVSQSVEPVLNIRTRDASVGDFVTGYSVPINALYTMDNMIGVVVADGGARRHLSA